MWCRQIAACRISGDVTLRPLDCNRQRPTWPSLRRSRKTALARNFKRPKKTEIRSLRSQPRRRVPAAGNRKTGSAEVIADAVVVAGDAAMVAEIHAAKAAETVVSEAPNRG